MYDTKQSERHVLTKSEEGQKNKLLNQQNNLFKGIN